MPPILTANDVVKEIAAECAFIDDRSAFAIGPYADTLGYEVRSRRIVSL